MNKLIKFFSQFNWIQVNEEEIIEMESFAYIPLKLSDQKIWLRILESATRKARDAFFIKRYKSVGNKFGYTFAIILTGNIEGKIEDLINIIELSLLEDPTPKQQITKKQGKQEQEYKPKIIPILDEEGKQIGEQKILKIHCPEKELNVKTEKGRGAEPTKAALFGVY